jgi:hypothetical protein
MCKTKYEQTSLLNSRNTLLMSFQNIDNDLIKQVVAKLVQASHPSKIILFCSCAWIENNQQTHLIYQDVFGLY